MWYSYHMRQYSTHQQSGAMAKKDVEIQPGFEPGLAFESWLDLNVLFLPSFNSANKNTFQSGAICTLHCCLQTMCSLHTVYRPNWMLSVPTNSHHHVTSSPASSGLSPSAYTNMNCNSFYHSHHYVTSSPAPSGLSPSAYTNMNCNSFYHCHHHVTSSPVPSGLSPSAYTNMNCNSFCLHSTLSVSLFLFFSPLDKSC